MKISLDISENLLHQFRRLFGASDEGDTGLDMNPEIGTGRMTLSEFPDGLEFYHYWSTPKQRLNFTSTNPASSHWYGLMVNLDDAELVRTSGAREVAIQRSLPAGMLLYPPGSTVTGVTPPRRRSESVFIRFHRDFLNAYRRSNFDSPCAVDGAVLYEDLDYRSETLLRDVIRLQSDTLAAHAKLMGFMSIFLDKIEARDAAHDVDSFHPEDLKGVFRAAAALRDPTAHEVPSVPELAKLAQMGVTKFKNAFRAVFGVAPIRYHHKIRMEYARDELLARRKSPSELSYELGYSHPSKFTTAFKKRFKVLPSQVHGARFGR